jgi:hypothetical protein
MPVCTAGSAASSSEGCTTSVMPLIFSENGDETVVEHLGF